SEFFRLVDPGYPIVLAPGEQRSVEVRFAPTSRGTFNGQVEFVWGPCSGATIANFVADVLLPSYSLSEETIDFGDLDIDAAELLRTITVTNDGDVERKLTVALQSALPGVRIVEPTTPTTLQPGESAEIVIGFNPDQTGPIS